MANDLTRYQDEVRNYFNNLPESSFEQVSCLFCGQYEKKHLLFRKETMEIYRCRCGFVWNGRQPTQDALNGFYKASNAMDEWAKIKSSELEEKRQAEKFDKAIQFLVDNEIETILDVGCGTGKFLSLLKKAAHMKTKPIREIGIDTNPASLKVAKSLGVTVLETTLDDLNPNLKFDAVTLWGVLEHVKDPKKTLDQCVDRLLPGGYLVICVPNVDSRIVRTLWEKCFTFCPQHLWHFNKEALQFLVGMNGLLTKDAYTVETEAVPIAKHRWGYAPYEPWPPYPAAAVDMSIANIQADIERYDTGYKVVGIFQKSRL